MPHSCEWPVWPTSLDEKWTCPDCGVTWFAWDGKGSCLPECNEPNHLGWSTSTGGSDG